MIKPNRYLHRGNETAICLVDKNERHVALAWIDTEDFDRAKKWRWSLGTKYPATNIEGYYISLHQFILKIVSYTNNMEIDHIDKNPLNNRKRNLRLCSRRENAQNRKLSKLNKSGHTGVSFNKAQGLWRSFIYDENSRQIYLGKFQNKEDAITARKQAEQKYGYL